jgi:hypothetical protein
MNPGRTICDSHKHGHTGDTSDHFWNWMEAVKSATVSGHRLVLEDGTEICLSDGSTEYSDYGEELTGMYTADDQL